jgi:hypothetical protein
MYRYHSDAICIMRARCVCVVWVGGCVGCCWQRKGSLITQHFFSPERCIARSQKGLCLEILRV